MDEEEALPRLRHEYRGSRGGEHPDWGGLDAAMVRDGRVVPAIRIEGFYPAE